MTVVPAAAAVQAQRPREWLDLSLEEAVALALRDNRELRSVRLWRAVDRFDLFLAHRAYWPSATVGISGIRRKSDGQVTEDSWTLSPSASWRSPLGTSVDASWTRYHPLGEGQAASEGFSTSVRQPLLRGAGLAVNMAPLRSAHIREEQARLAEADSVANLVDQVTYAYRALIQAQEQLELARLALERSRELLETNRLLIDAGRMAAADIIHTQSEVANQEVAILDSERSLNDARARLLSLLALDPNTAVRANDPVEVAPVVVHSDEAVQAAMGQRRDIRRMRLELEQAQTDEALARNARLWDVALVAGYDRFGTAGVRRDVTASSVGVQINIPLGDFSGRRNLMAAQAGRHTAQLRFDAELERIERQVRDAAADVASRWRQLEAALRARDLARQSLELHNVRLQAGRATNFEVLTLQAALRQADAQALSARIAYANALTALDQQMGRTLETWQISLED